MQIEASAAAAAKLVEAAGIYPHTHTQAMLAIHTHRSSILTLLAIVFDADFRIASDMSLLLAMWIS